MKSETTSHFPNILRLTLLDESTNKPIPRLAVTLIIYANRRNNYYLGLPLSDTKGIIEISRLWVSKAIDYLRNTYLMDYSSTLNECLPEVSIDVMSSDQILRAKSAMKLYSAETGGPDIAYSISDLDQLNNQFYEAKEFFFELNSKEEIRELVIRLKKLK